MKIKQISLLAFLLSQTVIQPVLATDARIRAQLMKPDDILTVNTGIGLATIVQFPETIQSMIIGDQSAYKIEYLDHSVTIKPLRSNAKTNFYVMTQSRRFDIKLQTVPQDLAQYVVYVKSVQKSDQVKWQTVSLKAETAGLSAMIDRVAATTDGLLLIEGHLISRNKTALVVQPKDFWALQGGKSKVLNSLFLADVKIEGGKPVLFGISILRRDLALNEPFTIEIRLPQKLSLTVPAGSL